MKQTVPRINPEVIRRSYSKLASPNPYYEGRDAIKGCAIRVLRQEVQIGVRADLVRASTTRRGVEPVVQAQPNTSSTEIDPACRQVYDAPLPSLVPVLRQ